MKCIRCGADSKYKERANRTCPGCNKPFAFEPRAGDPLTDAAFQNAIDAVSAKGQVRWGVEHLYYEIARRARGTIVPFLVAGAIFGIVGLFFLAVRHPIGLIPIGIAAFLAYIAWRRKGKTVHLALADFNRMWSAWRIAHGDPQGLIVRASPRGTPTPRRSFDSDIADYSFDRAVICDRARTADLLIANNFHFENNCAVLSMDGYPEPLFDTVRSMLKRNPKLRVFALHDASPSGCRMAHKLTNDPDWFAGQGKVTDVGLRPSQANVFRGLFLAAGPHVVAGAGISALEARWLSQNTLELAALRPEQILKRLYAAMNRKEHEDFDGDSFRYEASDAEDGGDGFG